MDVKLYTDNQYVPISELSAFDQEFIDKTKEYRQSFVEVVQVDNLHFANVVETPALVKKRFIKNIEIKGFIDIDPENHDYILELAKLIVSDKVPNNIQILERDKLKKLYFTNNKDLTIVTDYLLKTIDNIIPNKSDGDIKRYFPELSQFELMFISKFNNLNLKYSLKDFIDLNHTSYETARKALEKMHNLKLYDKAKVGKKYLYQPTSKLLALMKGSENHGN